MYVRATRRNSVVRTRRLRFIHYWDPNVMNKRFAKKRGVSDTHDAVTYKAHEKALYKTYEQNKDRVTKAIAELLPHLDLEGQWSIDVMQNGDDLWLIDMAMADQSAYYEDVVPKELRSHSKENWLPTIKGLTPGI